MSKKEEPRLIFLDGVWKLKLPDGTLRDATREEVEEILPGLKKPKEVS